jgi:hypothetical protein
MEAAKRCHELQAENAALRLDAERYRFLINDDNYDGWYPAYHDGYGKDRHEIVLISSITNIDEAIDAARAALGEKP